VRQVQGEIEASKNARAADAIGNDLRSVALGLQDLDARFDQLLGPGPVLETKDLLDRMRELGVVVRETEAKFRRLLERVEGILPPGEGRDRSKAPLRCP
jgi:hypothetical protein